MRLNVNMHKVAILYGVVGCRAFPIIHSGAVDSDG